jgi:hypothetical protein
MKVIERDGSHYVFSPGGGCWIEVEIADTGAVRPTGRSTFVQVPAFWVQQLAKAKCISTLKLAHHLLDKRFRSRDKSAPAVVTDAGAREAGVTCRRQRLRALQELAALGLIRVDPRQTSRSPRVRLQHV